jgi:hypothetical protein
VRGRGLVTKGRSSSTRTDDEQALREYIAQRERMGAELVVIVRSLAPRPADEPMPWR